MSWFDSNWQFRRKITVKPTNVDETLVDFPLYVPYGGPDYRFTFDDGSTQIPHVTYGESSYVKVPSITESAGATIYAYFGNGSASDGSDSAAVDDYVLFAPMRNSQVGNDLSPNGFALSGTNVTPQVNGVAIDGGYITIGGVGDVQGILAGNDGLTYTAVCLDLDAASDTDDLLSADLTSAYWQAWSIKNYGYYVHYSPNGGYSSAALANISLSIPISDYHLGFVYQCHDGLNPATAKSYMNGQQKAAGTSANADQTLIFGTISSAAAIGYLADPARSLNATVSEYRIRKGAASDAWLKFEHVNLMNSKNGLEIGSVRPRIPRFLLGGAM